MKRVMLVSTAFFLLASFGQTQALAEKIYWTGGGKIRRANLDGTEIQDLVSWEFAAFQGIALDLDEEKMYWADGASGGILRANLDGTAVEEVVAGLDRPDGVAVDVARGRIYWTDGGTDKIQRANLDGTHVEDVIPPWYLWDPVDLALDVAHGKVYWTGATISGPAVRRANLDGSGAHNLVTGLSWPRGIALDSANRHLYWVDRGRRPEDPGKIYCSNLEGTLVGVLLDDLSRPLGIALDPEGEHVYWTETGGGRIRRAMVDGSTIQTLITGLDPVPYAIALDLAVIPEPSTLALLAITGSVVLISACQKRKMKRVN
jgi:DNA-binding beta-propeller fold protein YncE